MTDDDAAFTRRALLGAVAVVVAGCTTHPRRRTADPDAEALFAARQAELLALSVSGGKAAEHAAHQAHLQALNAALSAIGAPLPTGRSPQPATPAPVDDRASVATLQAAARDARHGSNAALLASIAASHAVLAAARS